MKKLKWYHYIALAIWLAALVFLELKIYLADGHRPLLGIWIFGGFIIILAIGVELFRAPEISDDDYDI